MEWGGGIRQGVCHSGPLPRVEKPSSGGAARKMMKNPIKLVLQCLVPPGALQTLGRSAPRCRFGVWV